MNAFTAEFLRDLVYSQPPVPESGDDAREAVLLAAIDDESVLDEAA